MDANAIIATGSNDATYNASKLLPYILAKKPFLAVFHQDSPASQLLRTIGGATRVEFTNEDSEIQIAERINLRWVAEDRHCRAIPLVSENLNPYTDIGQSKIFVDFLNTLKG